MLSLHHLLLGKLSKEEYVEEFVFNYGEWLRDFAATALAGAGDVGVPGELFPLSAD